MEHEARLIAQRVEVDLTSLRTQLKELQGLSAQPMSSDVISSIGAAPSTTSASALMHMENAATALALPTMCLNRDAMQELRVLEGLGRVSEGAQRLRSFVELNHASLFKLCKLRDQLFGGSHGLYEQLPSLVAMSGVDGMHRFEDLQADIHKAFMSSPACEGLEASPEVARLASGLACRRSSGGMPKGERALFFFLGTAITLVVATIAILILPAKGDDLPQDDPMAPNVSYFMANFSLFRICLSVILILWGLGFVERSCAAWGVNHVFILDLDPRMAVGSRYFFGVAVILTSVLITDFLAYVLDYKYELIMPLDMHDQGFNDRASLHYMFYPTGLLILTFVLLILPSMSCRNRNKKAVLKSIGRVVAAPFFAVTFCDNIMGDVLTSLTKPFQDVPAAYCYLASGHPQTPLDVQTFHQRGDLCPQGVYKIAMPLIAGIPLWWRLLQCARRFHDSGDKKHLANLGKYFASIVVVLVGALELGENSIVVVIIVSIISTTYSATWDVFMDWGLGHDELLAIFSASPTGIVEQSEDAGVQDTTKTSKGRQLLFPKYFYPCAIIFDIVARCSWVISLLPITALTDDVPTRELFRFAMTALEIARRSVWAVIRIEHEQVANASKYRALMWVPTKVTNITVSSSTDYGSDPEDEEN